MHIPDGFLSADVALATAAAAAVTIGVAVRRAERTLDERRVPLLGVTAAFVFAAQMLNFPIAGGTSGHVLGGALATAVLGPWAAIVTLSVVVGVQALLFADGGLTALGANLLNMAVIGPLMAAAVMGGGRRVLRAREVTPVLAGVAAWCAVMVAAAAASLELALSGTVPLATVLPAMLGVHALIGTGEAVVTAAAVGAVRSSRPDLMRRPAAHGVMT
jgi:cobalt/nickel transport system permease protein